MSLQVMYVLLTIKTLLGSQWPDISLSVSALGHPRKKLESSMLKSKNQVTLFLNHSYNTCSLYVTFIRPKIYS